MLLVQEENPKTKPKFNEEEEEDDEYYKLQEPDLMQWMTYFNNGNYFLIVFAFILSAS